MKKQMNIGKTIAVIVCVLLLLLAVGSIAFFTNGFTSDFKTFYVESDGKRMLADYSNYVMKQDIAFADSGTKWSVGDSKTVIATAHPDGVPQTFEWSLTWDKSKTSSITYSVIKDKDPYDYLSLEIDGAECKITVLKYHKVGITYTVYLTLTATSNDNPDCNATCSIKLG